MGDPANQFPTSLLVQRAETFFSRMILKQKTATSGAFVEALIHWDRFISAVRRFLAYIIACAVPALAEVGEQGQVWGHAPVALACWGAREPDRKPGLLQGAHPGDLVH